MSQIPHITLYLHTAEFLVVQVNATRRIGRFVKSVTSVISGIVAPPITNFQGLSGGEL
jgi:hypothetical protein